MNNLVRGFRFGMLLQIAVGPVCLFIFKTSCEHGFIVGEVGVLGVTIVDAIYILSAILGLGVIIDKNEKSKTYLKIFGAIILIIFGVSNILGVFDISIIPSLDIEFSNSSNIFILAMILTLSSPLTIVFWAGIFSTKIIEYEMERKDMCVFGTGSVLSTLFFLTIVSLLGKISNTFFSKTTIDMLNIIVGISLIYFGIRLLVNKDKEKSKELIDNIEK